MSEGEAKTRLSVYYGKIRRFLSGSITVPISGILGVIGLALVVAVVKYQLVEKALNLLATRSITHRAPPI